MIKAEEETITMFAQKDKQLIFVGALLTIMALVALHLFLISKGISLDKLQLFNRKETTVVVADQYPGQIKLTSRAFENGATIPAKFSCNGNDVNPPLTISGVPANAQSLVVLVEDPDAPYKTFTHWILYNIDPRTKEIFENVLPWNAERGESDFGVPEYRGPCPPLGKHNYIFRVYALDIRLDIEDGADRKQIDKAMEDHILDVGELIGTFEK